MSTAINKKTSTAALAAAAAGSASLFLGAGTAQAAIDVQAIPNPGSVTVVVKSLNPNAPSGWCTYSARAQGNPIGKPLPAVNVPFFLPEFGSQVIPFVSFATGSTWDVTVDCPADGGTQFDTVTY